MQEYFDELQKSPANYVPLSPLSIIKRTADIYSGRTAVISGQQSFTWSEIYTRSRQLASRLQSVGINKGDTVAVLSPNNVAVFEAHFGIPMSGGVINTINTRLEPQTIAYILENGDAQLLICDVACLEQAKAALSILQSDIRVLVISCTDCSYTDYDAFVAAGDPEFEWTLPSDEWQALSLNYTSGTSGKPKGVVYHHRGSYLMALGTVAAWHLPAHPVYLYTVPMFHCNGWGHMWAMAFAGATVVCPDAITAKDIFNCIEQFGVTHFGGAPVVLSMLINAPENEKKSVPHTVQVMTAGAPPPAAVLEQTRNLGFEVMQVYGLTETFGHVTQCLWQEQWQSLPFAEQAQLQSRQGVTLPITEDAVVVNQDTGEPVPRDGVTTGEIVIRGNTVMKGYYKNLKATKEAFDAGWFRTGDVAVWWDSGYIQIKDRLKDVIISGGENVSSVEVENTLCQHPSVALAAVVAKSDVKWGEVPCAFVALKPGEQVTEEELIRFCRNNLAGFKTPKSVFFGDLPQTATGKIQKYILRERVKTQNLNE